MREREHQQRDAECRAELLQVHSGVAVARREGSLIAADERDHRGGQQHQAGGHQGCGRESDALDSVLTPVLGERRPQANPGERGKHREGEEELP
jgi:hypothetical protein